MPSVCRFLGILALTLCLAGGARAHFAGVSTTLPGTCRAYDDVYVLLSSSQQYLCNADGESWTVLSPAPAAPAGIVFEGEEVAGIRYAVATVCPGTATLGSHSLVLADTGTTGCALTLPDASLSTTTGRYEIIITAGTAALTLNPFAGQTINGSSTSPPAITGVRSRYLVTRTGNTAWDVSSLEELTVPVWGIPGSTAVLTGVGTLCSSTAVGSTNNSSSGSGADFDHSLVCPIPANTLQGGDHLSICVGYRFVTGAAAPTFSTGLKLEDATPGSKVDLARSGSAGGLGNNVASAVGHLCFGIHAVAGSGDILNLYTTVPGLMDTMDNSSQTSFTVQPVAINKTLAYQIETFTRFTTAGTPTNTVQQLYLRGTK